MNPTGRYLALFCVFAVTLGGMAMSAPPRSVSADIRATAFVTDPVGITEVMVSAESRHDEAEFGLRVPGNVSVLVIRQNGREAAQVEYFPAAEHVRLETGHFADGDTLLVIPTDL